MFQKKKEWIEVKNQKNFKTYMDCFELLTGVLGPFPPPLHSPSQLRHTENEKMFLLPSSQNPLDLLVLALRFEGPITSISTQKRFFFFFNQT